MATRAQQVIVLQDMRDKVKRALDVARVYQQTTVNVDPDNPDTSVPLTPAQTNTLGAQFDSFVAAVKADALTL